MSRTIVRQVDDRSVFVSVVPGVSPVFTALAADIEADRIATEAARDLADADRIAAETAATTATTSASSISANIVDYTGFPGVRPKFGALRKMLVPEAIKVSNIAALATPFDTVSINAGTTSRFYCAGSTYHPLPSLGSANFHFSVVSGTPDLALAKSNAIINGVSYAFVQRGSFYYIERTIPAGITSFVLQVTNSSAVTPLVITVPRYATAEANTTGEARNPELISLENLKARDYIVPDGTENLWSYFTPISIAAGAASTVYRANGITVPPGQRQFGLAYVKNTATGAPAIIGRHWMKYAWSAGSANVFMEPLQEHPGYYIWHLDPAVTTLGGSTIYLEYTADNTDESPFHTAVALQTTILGVWDDQLPTFALSAEGAAAAAVYTNPQPGLVLIPSTTQKHVFLPAGSPGSDRGISLRLDNVTGLADGLGGTTSNCWNIKHVYDARRLASDNFTTVSQITDDNGQEGFAVFLTDSTEIVGFEAHGRCRATATPVIRADGVLIGHAATTAVNANQIDIVTRHTITNYAGTTDILDVVALYRFDALRARMEEYWWLKVLSNFTSHATYVAMFSPKLTTVDEILLPERGFLAPSSTSQGTTADLGARKVTLAGDAGFQFDFEIMEAPATAEMWTQATGTNLKIYPTMTPLANTSRAAVKPAATALTTGQTLFMRTAMTLRNGNLV